MDVTQTKIKKRGRPRKNCVKPNTNIKQCNVEEDIILHLALSSNDINNEKVNGYEIIQTECGESEAIEDDLSGDEDPLYDESTKQLMDTIKEKDKIIDELKEKIVVDDNHQNLTIFANNIKLYPIEMPYEQANDNNFITPEVTNKCCIWDTEAINGIPCFLPDKYYDNKFFVLGCFCSLNCALAYNLSLDDFKMGERCSLLKWMYAKTDENIIPAPSFRILDKFGGMMSIDEYRKKLIKCTNEYRILMPPMTYIHQTIEEKNRSSKGSNSGSHSEGRKRSSIIDIMKHKK